MFSVKGRGHSRPRNDSRPRVNEHIGQVGGRGHARAPPASKPGRKKDQPSILSRYFIPKLDASIMTIQDILFYGLCFVGFGEERQGVTNDINRFKAHFGPEPCAVKDLMTDLCDRFPNLVFKELLMGLNWLRVYDVEEVLAGRWNYVEDTCRDKCRETCRRIQSLKKDLINFDPSMFRPEEIHIITIDCVNFTVQEFRLDPSTGWFDQKSHSSGLKYEFALSIWQSTCVWINGPYPAGKYPDGTIFSGDKDLDKRDSLYYQIPEGKKGIADSAYAPYYKKVTVKRRGHSKEVFDFLDTAQNRQESYHGRLEGYSILSHRFRCGTSTEDKMALHKMAVEAVAVLMEYDMVYHPLMEV